MKLLHTCAITLLTSPRLYNLDNDIGEKNDVAAQNPEVVKRLQELIAKMGADLGIDKSNKKNAAPGVRPAGRVNNPQPLLLPGKKPTN